MHGLHRGHTGGVILLECGPPSYPHSTLDGCSQPAPGWQELTPSHGNLVHFQGDGGGEAWYIEKSGLIVQPGKVTVSLTHSFSISKMKTL